jgi:antirestriction protein ArdC
MAYRTTCQFGLREALPWPKRVPAWLTGIGLTFNQTAKLDGHLRKGERSSVVTFRHLGEEKSIRDAEGNERQARPFLLRYDRVFDAQQTKGIADKLGLTGASFRVAN